MSVLSKLNDMNNEVKEVNRTTWGSDSDMTTWTKKQIFVRLTVSSFMVLGILGLVAFLPRLF